MTGAGHFTEGATCTLVASPASGASFVGYYENNVLVSAQATYSFTVNANRILEARFTGVTPTTYNVTATAGQGGTVSGGGSFAAGASCTLTATPASGYHFLGWYENNSQISTTNPMTISVNGDRTIEGRFEADAPASGHTLTLISNDQSGNELPYTGFENTGAGTYAAGTVVEISTGEGTPSYSWNGWYSEPGHSHMVSSQKAFSYTMPDHDITLYAYWSNDAE